MDELLGQVSEASNFLVIIVAKMTRADLIYLSMQLHMGIIAASVPTLKPLFKKSATPSHINQYDDIERAQTVGSAGKPSKRRRTFLTTNGTVMGDDNFEMSTRSSVRESMLEKFTASGQGKNNTVYSVTEERVGSEDNMLEFKQNLKGIRCTTEVTVNHTDKPSRS
jgi:hypothetical protein